MDEQQGLFLTPIGLSQPQLQRLEVLGAQAAECLVEELLGQVESHAEEAQRAHASSRLVNVRLAEAIRDTYRKIVSEWDALPAQSHSWFRGAMQYFISCNDDEPDFQSAIGFEDDCEVLNACLRMVGRDEQCVRVEDYDDA